MKAMPTIQKFMTTTPHSIGAEQNLKTAQALMIKHEIRHLPVMKNGTLAGILTDRDLKLAFGIRGVDPEKTLVEEVAIEEPCLTSPQSSLSEVAHLMADKKIGSALVVDHHKLVGIFTTTDALMALASVLEARHH